MRSRFRRLALPFGLLALVVAILTLTLLVGSSSGTPTLATGTPTPPQAPAQSIGALATGYWKNHLANSNSNGPFFSPDCATVSNYGGSCSTSGPWAIQYLPQTLGNYSVDTITKAAMVFKATNCSSSKDQDAIGCLVGQLLATKLSLANGSLACPGILQTVADVDAFLEGQTVNGVPGINYAGPTGGPYTLNSAQRSFVVSRKNDLNTYNMNKGCPVVAPAPTIVTQVSSTTAIVNHTSIMDLATLTGSNGTVTGSVAYFVCGPTGSATPCVSGGASAGSGTLSGGQRTSDAFTPTAAGTYCFRVEYTSDSSHYSSNASSVTTNECFTAVQATATPTPTPPATATPTATPPPATATPPPP